MKKFYFITVFLVLFLIVGCQNKEYQIHFNSHGGTELASVSTQQGREIQSLPVPEMKGYSFVGWFLNLDDSTTLISETSIINEETTLHAMWELVEYTITFDTKGGISIESIKATIIDSVILPVAHYSGYHFEGWYKDLNDSSRLEGEINVDSDLTLNAKWVNIDDVLEFSLMMDGTYLVSSYVDENRENYVIPKYYNDVLVTMVGMQAFYECQSIVSIYLHDSINDFDPQALEGCPSFTTIIVDEDNPYFSSLDGVLYDKDQTILLKYPQGRTEQEYLIPETVSEIGYRSFIYSNSLQNIFISNSITTIENQAFLGCTNLVSIDVADNNEKYKSIDGVMFSKDQSVLIQYPAGKTDATYTIPTGVTRIRSYAFASAQFTNVNIPNTVTELGGSTFSGCTNLIAIEIPDSITELLGMNFWGCISLTSVSLPNNLEKIGRWTFAQCTSLENIELPGSLQIIDWWAFVDCSALDKIVITENIIEIGAFAFQGCSVITIYCTMNETPAGWHSSWSTGVETVIWDYECD